MPNYSTLPRDILTGVFSFLDTYDANELRLVSKSVHEDVVANETFFRRPYYVENARKYCLMQTSTRDIYSVDPCCEVYYTCDPSLSKKNYTSTYILYVLDDWGGWPHFDISYIDILGIVESHDACKRGILRQRKI